MKSNHLIYFIVIVLYGCTNPVKESQIGIKESLNSFLCAEISLVNTTLDFAMYSSPNNYWYMTENRNETEAVVDRLQKLILMAEAFEYSDYFMMQAKKDLIAVAQETRNELIESYNNRGTSDYFAYQFMGELGLIMNKQVESIPETLKKAIIKMDSIVRDRYFTSLPEKIFQLEMNAIGDNEISIDQYKEVRSFTLLSVKDSLLNNIECENLEWEKRFVDNIMNSFANQFPVNDAYKYICYNQKYAGTLLKFMATSNVDYCRYDNLTPIDCSFGYIFISLNNRVIYRTECLRANTDSVEYKIGKCKEARDKIICTFKKSFTHPMLVVDTNNSMSVEEMYKRGVMRKINNERVELLPTDCSQWLSMFQYDYELNNGNKASQTYVVKIASLEEYNSFVDDVKHIKELRELFE